MFKFFGVGENENNEELDVEIIEDKDLDTDVGQLALDIIETPYEIIILSPIAGVNLDDIDLAFSNSILTIKGFRLKPELGDDLIIRNSECFWGKFVRNIILPDNLDFDNIKALMENNLLIIRIKKLTFPSQNIKIDRIEI